MCFAFANSARCWKNNGLIYIENNLFKCKARAFDSFLLHTVPFTRPNGFDCLLCRIWRRIMNFTLCSFFPFVCRHKHYPLNTAWNSKHPPLRPSLNIWTYPSGKSMCRKRTRELWLFHNSMCFTCFTYYTHKNTLSSSEEHICDMAHWGSGDTWRGTWYSHAYIILKTSVCNVSLCYCLMRSDHMPYSTRISAFKQTTL